MNVMGVLVTITKSCKQPECPSTGEAKPYIRKMEYDSAIKAPTYG